MRVIKKWRKPIETQLGLVFQDNPAGPGRRYAKHDAPTPLRHSAFSAFGIKRIKIEPMFRDFVGEHYLDGAHAHEHSDPAPEGWAHVRCNWMLKKPTNGGNPVIDGIEYDVDEEDLWICIASLESHSSTPIEGGIRRIYSFGALVPIEDILCMQ